MYPGALPGLLPISLCTQAVEVYQKRRWKGLTSDTLIHTTSLTKVHCSILCKYVITLSTTENWRLLCKGYHQTLIWCWGIRTLMSTSWFSRIGLIMIYCPLSSSTLTIVINTCRVSSGVWCASAKYLNVTACASSAVSYPKSVFHRTHRQRFSCHCAVSWGEKKARCTALASLEDYSWDSGIVY